MTFTKKTLIAGTALVALAACEGPMGQAWHQEAGAFLDEGGFGNPTMQNMMAQMCSGQAKGYIVPDPVVVAAPDGKGGTSYQRGHVMCSGHLNGKYAQVIFDEYVNSARPRTTLSGGVEVIESSGSGG